jgi:carboxymethylenebutenolidase
MKFELLVNWFAERRYESGTTVGGMGEMIEFPSNGSTAGGYLAVPEGGCGPGVIVIQEWWGLVDHIIDVCDRFAAEGFVALAPDLYHGQKVPPGEPDEAGKAMMAMRLDQAGRDMSGAIDELLARSSSAHVGVIGFCMGGGLALVLATQRPDAVSAVVPCYGIIPWPDVQPDYSALEAKVLGHYAEKDGYFTPEAAMALGEQLRGLGKSVEIIVYPGVDHAFFNDTRPEVYDAEASRALWERSVAFFRENVR